MAEKRFLEDCTKGGFGIDNIYIPYHIHSDYSLLDSCTDFSEYVNIAIDNGFKAIASTEHGKPMGWVTKKMLCDSLGIKFIHGVEIYLTESLDEKIRDNYHTVLLARNFEGVKEINRLVSLSCNEDHFYYTNRLSFDEFLEISDNIISTSACLASPLNKLDKNNYYYSKLANKYSFYEIQPHKHPDQIEYNRLLYEMSKEYNKPLIAATDTHSSDTYKAECRSLLLESKHKNYGDEDSFDLTFRTYDKLVEDFRSQNSLPMDVCLEAIQNTNILYELCEDFKLDNEIKYPILYGTRERDSDEFDATVARKFEEKINSGVIPQNQIERFKNAIEEEMRVFKKLHMDGFMLSMSELISWCKENNIAIGPARGSVGGSRVAYVTDVIDLNPETWGTVFSRFCNEDRVEIGDIDIDCIESDRPMIFKHIISRFGNDKTARVASFGTIKSKGVIDDVCRGLAIRYNKDHGDIGNNPYSLSIAKKIKDVFESDQEKARKKYPEVFYYYDGLIDTKVSQSVHPAGMVISPITLDDNYGVFKKDDDMCLMLDMEEAHEVGLAKYDFLVLKTVQVIRDACNYIGVNYPKSHEIDWNDLDVWDDMQKNLSTIFQFESAFAADSFRKFKPQSIFDMSLVTASIRPTGSSYRDQLLARKVHKNPSEMIDELLKNNLGYLVYQEDTIAFLQQICGLSGSEADNIRRAIGRKQKDRLDKAMPSILEGYCSKSDKPRESAEEEAKEFLQVIEDSASYQFGYNHSIAYCLLGYLCGYYRYYYPVEYITSFLNNAANDDDIKNGTIYAGKRGIRVTMPKWGVSRKNYFYDADNKIIAKGLSSIKYMGENIADELLALSKRKKYSYFVDLLDDLTNETSLDSRQLDILIKIDFFSDFGNQKQLLKIVDIYENMFKKGSAKQIKKSLVDNLPIGEIISKYSVGVTKSGGEAKSYTLLDIKTTLKEVEKCIKNIITDDLDDYIKAKNFKEAMGYAGYVSGRESDRKKLYVMNVYELKRKSDGAQFGYSVITKSIGSGKEARSTVFNKLYKEKPINEGDIILCKSFEVNGSYFTIRNYDILHKEGE